jgi:hypothetical protein
MNAPAGSDLTHSGAIDESAVQRFVRLADSVQRFVRLADFIQADEVGHEREMS